MADRTIPRIKILDHVKLGKKICEWSLKPDSRPKDIREMKRQLRGIATFPPRIKGVAYVQADLATFVVRVPNADMVRESLKYMRDHNTGPYPGAKELYYYVEKLAEDDPDITNLDFLYSRIADYTIAQCK
ncbi:MAG TPA: hypothetical protein VHE77_11445 [Dongiaceae bacterium]|jgi:hypothetical protein|nr:hypothetical protein [Dongiaceae bacterium]